MQTTDTTLYPGKEIAMQATETNESAGSHQLRFEDIAPAGEELSEDELQRVTGGMRPVQGDFTYHDAETACWDPYFP